MPCNICIWHRSLLYFSLLFTVYSMPNQFIKNLKFRFIAMTLWSHFLSRPLTFASPESPPWTNTATISSFLFSLYIFNPLYVWQVEALPRGLEDVVNSRENKAFFIYLLTCSFVPWEWRRDQGQQIPLFGTDPDRNRVTWETPSSEAIPNRWKPLRRTRLLRDPGANAGMKRTSVVEHNLYFASLAIVG